jgi:hypothetical protein
MYLFVHITPNAFITQNKIKRYITNQQRFHRGISCVAFTLFDRKVFTSLSKMKNNLDELTL